MAVMRPQSHIPVAGIGASAGGLKALEGFFRAVPPDTGMAFIVVTHLPKNYKSALHTILARYTKMTVVSVGGGERIKPDHVYVCPAGQVVTIKRGRLKVSAPQPQLEHFPIDQALASLAEDCTDNAVGILLSGGGSDGTKGLAAIKQQGGLTMVQGPDGSELAYPEMPQSAIAAGVVDLTLPVEEMGPRLAKFALSQTPVDGDGEGAGHAQIPDKDGARLQQQIAALLLAQLGHDFSGYKTGIFMRRVQRRMQLLQIASLENYIAHLQEKPEEAYRLFRSLLIGVTSFFRDSPAFEALKSRIIPKLFEGAGPGETIRIWVPACATGEEAYSLAILMREHMDGLTAPPKVQIFATDIDETSIELARAGNYHLSELAEVSEERRRRFFTCVGTHCKINRDIRDMCVFSQHNVLENPPFFRLDLVSCRNLLIYFGPQFQAQILPLFHFALKPGRYLFLGTSENVSQHADLFIPVDKKYRIYQRRDEILSAHNMLPQARTVGHSPAAPNTGIDTTMTISDLHHRVEHRILERFAPAHVVVNREGDILYYSARTGSYLEQAAGAPSRQLLAMAPKEIRQDLRATLREAHEQQKHVECQGLSFGTNGGVRRVDLIVEPFGTYESDPLFLVIFRDSGSGQEENADAESESGRFGRALGQAEQELAETRRRLQIMVEEYETAVEELKSSNEEFQSINEELQSANEELETSKEEMQSVNEELDTVNIALQKRVEELDRAHADLRNVFESTQVAIIFLDRKRVIRTFTPAATAIFKLISSDRGRPLTDIANNLREIGDLSRDIQTVFEHGKPVERQVRHTDGHAHYVMRILPYRNDQGVIDGTLIVFMDVSQLVEFENRQRSLLADANMCVTGVIDMVKRIAQEPPAKTATAGQYHQAFLGRVHALAACADLLNRNAGGDIALADLVHALLGDRPGAQISVTGPQVTVRSIDALALYMVLHELADHAHRHGTLSRSGGKLAVAWKVTGTRSGKSLQISWRESGSAAASKPAPKLDVPKLDVNFIEQIAKADLHGTARIDCPKGCTTAVLTIPRDDTASSAVAG